jgi:serine/threonine protein kinase
LERRRVWKAGGGRIKTCQSSRSQPAWGPFLKPNTLPPSHPTPKLFLIMDFLAGGELFYHLGLQGLLLESQCSFYVAEIILALSHLHERSILHRDLKPENILLGSDGHCCLTDFGLAKEFKEETEEGKLRTICGTNEVRELEELNEVYMTFSTCRS